MAVHSGNRMTRRAWITGGVTAVLGTAILRSSWATPPGSPSLRILFFTDVHAGFDDWVAKPLAAAAEVMRLIDADVAICGGDVIHRGYLLPEAECGPRFGQYRDFLKKLRRPVEHVIGNHDLAGAFPDDGSEPASNPRAMVMSELGIRDRYRTFDVAGYRFVMLDVVELTGGELKYRGFIDREQMEWLRGVVDDWSVEKPMVVVTHIPFRTTFLQAKESPGASLTENLVVVNANELLSIFDGRNLPLVLQGHLHSNEVIDWAGRKFVMGGAICAGWWRGRNLETGFGFGILEVAPGRSSWEYRGYGWTDL